MTVYIALLRAVNLASKRRVPMAELREVLTAAGYDDVRTYLQSGNAIVSSTKRSPAALSGSLESLISEAFGFQVDVAVRAATQMTNVSRSNPFAGRGQNPDQLHVAFLTGKPAAAAARKLHDLEFEPEEFVLRGTEIYLRYPNGLGRSKMNPAAFERALGVPATVRSWKVVNKLTELASTAPG